MTIIDKLCESGRYLCECEDPNCVRSDSKGDVALKLGRAFSLKFKGMEDREELEGMWDKYVKRMGGECTN